MRKTTFRFVRHTGPLGRPDFCPRGGPVMRECIGGMLCTGCMGGMQTNMGDHESVIKSALIAPQSGPTMGRSPGSGLGLSGGKDMDYERVGALCEIGCSLVALACIVALLYSFG